MLRTQIRKKKSLPCGIPPSAGPRSGIQQGEHETNREIEELAQVGRVVSASAEFTRHQARIATKGCSYRTSIMQETNVGRVTAPATRAVMESLFSAGAVTGPTWKDFIIASTQCVPIPVGASSLRVVGPSRPEAACDK